MNVTWSRSPWMAPSKYQPGGRAMKPKWSFPSHPVHIELRRAVQSTTTTSLSPGGVLDPLDKGARRPLVYHPGTSLQHYTNCCRDKTIDLLHHWRQRPRRQLFSYWLLSGVISPTVSQQGPQQRAYWNGETFGSSTVLALLLHKILDNFDWFRIEHTHNNKNSASKFKAFKCSKNCSSCSGCVPIHHSWR